MIANELHGQDFATEFMRYAATFQCTDILLILYKSILVHVVIRNSFSAKQLSDSVARFHGGMILASMLADLYFCVLNLI